MSEVIGKDIDGNGIRPGDQVELVNPETVPEEYLGQIKTVKQHNEPLPGEREWLAMCGRSPDDYFQDTEGYAHRYKSVRLVRKQHTPADEGFESMIKRLNTQKVSEVQDD